MAKITKFGDKIAMVSESASIYFYDNAYMVEATGRNAAEDWTRVKLVARDLNEVLTMLREIDSLPKA
jgi:hypothetical protein